MPPPSSRPTVRAFTVRGERRSALAAETMASLVMAVVLGAIAPLRAVRADELPEDTNTIESLTPEQARNMAATQGVLLEYRTAEGNRVTGRGLALRSLKSLDAAVAEELAGYEFGAALLLDGLATLSDEAAKALARYKGHLSLDGLTALSPAVAQALAACEADLSLDGLTTLSDEAAEALARHKRGLSLDGLTTLSDEAARALARHKGDLSLDGLTALSPAAAQAIASCDGNLSLGGLTMLSDETAETLALHRTKGKILSLNGLTTLSETGAQALARYPGNWLRINGLTTLSAGTARALLQRRGRTQFLGGLTRLDVETARVLAAAANWDGRLPSITALDSEDSVEIAAALAARKGFLWLPKLTTISPQALRALFGESDPVNPADTPPELPANAARAPVLAAQGGGLQRQNVVFIGGLTRLDVETARVLAAAEKWDGRLPSLTAFDSVDSVAIAQALATRKGPLLLPKLKHISPRTLSALIVKQDVEIPLVETLEFIAEPDGGPTEDFVIPDWLQQRQKQRAASGLIRPPQ